MAIDISKITKNPSTFSLFWYHFVLKNVSLLLKFPVYYYKGQFPIKYFEGLFQKLFFADNEKQAGRLSLMGDCPINSKKDHIKSNVVFEITRGIGYHIYGKFFWKNSKIRPSTVSKIQAIFNNFCFIFSNSGNILCCQTL